MSDTFCTIERSSMNPKNYNISIVGLIFFSS